MDDGSNIDDRVKSLLKDDQFKQFFGDVGMDVKEVDDLLKHDDAAEFMSFQNETNINYDEVPKELEIKDGINRLKQLALKVSAYMHVKHHDPVPWMFQNDDIKTEKGPTFHLRQ